MIQGGAVSALRFSSYLSADSRLGIETGFCQSHISDSALVSCCFINLSLKWTGEIPLGTESQTVQRVVAHASFMKLSSIAMSLYRFVPVPTNSLY